MHENYADAGQAIVQKGIAARATQSCFNQTTRPDKKTKKFIVTLKPVPKAGQDKTVSECHCDKFALQPDARTHLKAEDELRGKATILNAFRLLAHSKFITIDQNVTNSGNINLEPPFNLTRLTGGSDNSANQKEVKKLRTEAKKQEPKKKEVKLNESKQNEAQTKESLDKKPKNICTDTTFAETARTSAAKKSQKAFWCRRKSPTKDNTFKKEELVFEEEIQYPAEDTATSATPLPKETAPETVSKEKYVTEICKPRELKKHSEVIRNNCQNDLNVRSNISQRECPRIMHLEHQVEAMRRELSRIKREFIPQEDIMRYSALARRLQELNSMLAEMKHSCVVSMDAMPSNATSPSNYNNEQLQKVQTYICQPESQRNTQKQTTCVACLAVEKATEEPFVRIIQTEMDQPPQQAPKSFCTAGTHAETKPPKSLYNSGTQPETKPPNSLCTSGTPAANKPRKSFCNSGTQPEAKAPKIFCNSGTQPETKRTTDSYVQVQRSPENVRRTISHDRDSQTSATNLMAPKAAAATVETETTTTPSYARQFSIHDRFPERNIKRHSEKDRYSQTSATNLVAPKAATVETETTTTPSYARQFSIHDRFPERNIKRHSEKDRDSQTSATNLMAPKAATETTAPSHARRFSIHDRFPERNVKRHSEKGQYLLEETQTHPRYSSATRAESTSPTHGRRNTLHETPSSEKIPSWLEKTQPLPKETSSNKGKKSQKEPRKSSSSSLIQEENVKNTDPPKTTTKSNNRPENNNFCVYCEGVEVPVVDSNLQLETRKIIQQHNPCDVALTIVLQADNLYHINIAIMKTGESLGCLFATENGINCANEEHVFEEFLTFFVVDANNTMEQKNKILGHTFEFCNN